MLTAVILPLRCFLLKAALKTIKSGMPISEKAQTQGEKNSRVGNISPEFSRQGGVESA